MNRSNHNVVLHIDLISYSQQILKYVEEDIVLSLNTRWLCLSSASAIWEPAFAELSLPDLILRKLLQVNLAPTDSESKLYKFVPTK